MTTPQAFWREVSQRFDPQDLAESDWVVARSDTPTTEIGEALALPFETSRFLLGSTPGTGTTTELRRLISHLPPDDQRLVVALDLQRHFSEVVRDLPALQAITPHEVLFLVGLAVVQAAKTALHPTWGDKHLQALQQAWKAVLGVTTTAQIDTAALLASLGSSALLAGSIATDGGVSAGLAVGASGVTGIAKSVRWNFPFGRHPQRADQDSASKELFSAVSGAITGLQRQHNRRVVLVLDGLDRIESAEITRALFVTSRIIGQLPCSIIAAAPISLRHGLDAALVEPFQYRVLPNIPVLSRSHPTDPRMPGPGVSVLRELYRLRTHDLTGAVLPLPLVDKLARASGGHVRAFVQLIRSVANRSYSRQSDVATLADVEDVVSRLGKDMDRSLRRSHYDALRAVLDAPNAPLPDGGVVDELLRTRRLLPYANGVEWFFPHPTLIPRLSES